MKDKGIPSFYVVLLFCHGFMTSQMVIVLNNNGFFQNLEHLLDSVLLKAEFGDVYEEYLTKK